MKNTFISGENLGSPKCPINGEYNNVKSEESVLGAIGLFFAGLIIGPYIIVSLIAAILGAVFKIQDSKDKKLIANIISKLNKEDVKKLQDFCLNFAKASNDMCYQVKKIIESELYDKKGYSECYCYPDYSELERNNKKANENVINTVMKRIINNVKSGKDPSHLFTEFEIYCSVPKSYFDDEDADEDADDGGDNFWDDLYDRVDADAKNVIKKILLFKGKKFQNTSSIISNITCDNEYDEDLGFKISVETEGNKEVAVILGNFTQVIKQTVPVKENK